MKPITVLFGLMLGAVPAFAAPKPNVVLILADDLGWADLGCTGSSFYETPRLDRLAAESVRFTQAYAACPVCSPTRAALMTGKYPTRTGVTDYINLKEANQPENWSRPTPLLPARYRMHLEPAEVTLAEYLKAAGYATGIFGKWHLASSPETLPDRQGFDTVDCGREGTGRGYTGPDRADIITDSALKFIEVNRDRPFFAYIPHNMVHTPLVGPPALVEKYKRKSAALAIPDSRRWGIEGKSKLRIVQDHPEYAAMTESLDDNVGRVLDKLAELKLDQQTIVIFTSDNGGLATSEGHPTTNLPLRAGKGWLYEAGTRVPTMIRWPGVTRAGTVLDHPIITMDFFATVLSAANVVPDPAQPADGQDLTPLLRGGSLPDRPLFWHYPHYGNQGGSPGAVIRKGDWKLIEWFEGRTELYNLADDLGEKTNLAERYPDRVRAMRAELSAWQTQTGAKFPTPRNTKEKAP